MLTGCVPNKFEYLRTWSPRPEESMESEVRKIIGFLTLCAVRTVGAPKLNGPNSLLNLA